MKNILVFNTLLLFTISIQAQKYFPFKNDNGKYGFKDSLNTILVEPKYAYAYDFHESMAIVSLNNKYGCINEKGEEIIPLKYENINNFHEGVAACKLNAKCGFLDKTGHEVIPVQYSYVSDFSEGTARVSEGYSKNYIIDKTGKELFPIDQYSEVKNCEYGLFKVKKSGKWGCLSKTGEVVIEIKYDNLLIMQEGFVSVQLDEKWGGIDNNYQLTIPILYGNAMSFREGLAAVKLDEKWGFIDKTGKTIIPFQYDEWWGGFKDNIATVKLNEEKFDIDKTGKRLGKQPVIKTPAKEPVKPKVAGGVILTDTAFHTLGVKFGFPKGYKVFIPKDNPQYMTFYKADSSIIITVYNVSGMNLERLSEEWPEPSKKPGADGWYKNIGKTAKKDYGHTKPVYISDYFYPFTFGGANFIWICLKTTKPNTGIKEFEAVKASVKRRPLPLIQREIVPGIFTMGIPAYLNPKSDLSYLSQFDDGYTFLWTEKYNGTSIGNFDAMLQHKDWKTRTGFKSEGSINCISKSNNIDFTGYYGLHPDPLGKFADHYEAYIFFNKPGTSGSHECWVMHYILSVGISTTMKTDIEEFLKTAKLIK